MVPPRLAFISPLWWNRAIKFLKPGGLVSTNTATRCTYVGFMWCACVTSTWRTHVMACFSVDKWYIDCPMCIQIGKAVEGGKSGHWQTWLSVKEDRPLWIYYWKTPVPHEILIFGWKNMHNSLATNANQNNRTIEVTNTCKICGAKEELGMHALVCCPIFKSSRRQWD